jgi:hypothetical protein
VAETLPPLVNPNSPTANYGDQLYQQGVADTASMKAASQAKYLGVENLDSRVAELISPTKTPLVSEAVKNAQAKLSGSTGPRLEDFDNIAAAMKYEIPPSDLDLLLSKIPKSVKEWATMTGVSLLDMWIKKSLFGQDYDDQIAEGGGGGGGVLRGSSPVVSPYSGGGSGGGGKGVLFSMGGSGQQGRGTHIMALQ